jgi:ATP/maltotriose-dependent transcriptional regulator MalT
VFNYFTVEVFHRLDERIKEFLFTTSLLDEISPEISSGLTGVEDSGAILAWLNRNHYFTDL